MSRRTQFYTKTTESNGEKEATLFWNKITAKTSCTRFWCFVETKWLPFVTKTQFLSIYEIVSSPEPAVGETQNDTDIDG